jgi:uncharacterized protein
VRFRQGARLDGSQVQDRRHLGGRGAAVAGGGGVIGLLLWLAVSFLGGDDGSVRSLQDLPLGRGGPAVDLAESCQTGADANQRDDCLIVGVVNSVQDHWESTVSGYRRADTVLFSGGVTTACGSASSAVGPFYCPADETIYLDLSFFGELERRFGASGGPFAQAYVVGHEYGHHVQHLTGDAQRVDRGRTGPTSGAVRLELQADCYAGVWAHHAASQGLIEELTDADIEVGLSAAAAVGDDRIQERSGGSVNPEAWTHGSSEQRQQWFTTGHRTGSPSACDTFSADSL